MTRDYQRELEECEAGTALAEEKLREAEQRHQECEESWPLVEQVVLVLQGNVEDLLKLVQQKTKK